MSQKTKTSRLFITDADYERATRITRLILENQDLEEAKKEILLGAIARYSFHMQNSYQAQMLYRRLAHTLAITTPTLGAIVTAISLIQVQSIVLALLGVLVTISSAIDSAYKASHGFEKCADIMIDLNDWVLDFEVRLLDGLENDQNFSSQGFSQFARRKNQELSEIGKDYASTVIPYFPGLRKNAFDPPSTRMHHP